MAPRRIQQLARRVSWLDSNRRTIAMLGALTLTLFVISQLSSVPDWPPMHAMLLTVMIGLVTWCALEVVLVWLTAIWETECARLIRERDLPRAVVHKR